MLQNTDPILLVGNILVYLAIIICLICLAILTWGLWKVFFHKPPMRPLVFQRHNLGHEIFQSLTVVGFDENVMPGVKVLVLQDEEEEKYFVYDFPNSFTPKLIGTSLANVKLQRIVFPGMWQLVSWDAEDTFALST